MEYLAPLALFPLILVGVMMILNEVRQKLPRFLGKFLEKLDDSGTQC